MKRVLLGEINQMTHAYNTDITYKDYLKSIKGKTAQLFELSCYEGSYFGQCDPEIIEKSRSIGQIIIASIPTAITVMAILLANNICDLEEDIEDGRFTLPYHIGTDKALLVFKYFYYTAYIAVIFSVIFGTFPRSVTLSLLTFPYVLKNIRIFMNEQDKETTFMTTIINSVVIPVPIIITFFIGAWIGI